MPGPFRSISNMLGAVVGGNQRDSTKRTSARRSFGDTSERAAEKFLKRKGMIIVERNFEDRFGEIDLIVVDQRTLVFVEVKARRSHDAGEGFEAVDETKQAKIVKTALGYLKRNELLENAYRFDIVSMLWPKNQRRPTIEHFDNAFRPADKNQMFG